MLNPFDTKAVLTSGPNELKEEVEEEVSVFVFRPRQILHSPVCMNGRKCGRFGGL